LQSLGYSVCWETQTREQADRELTAARISLTLWSALARESLDVCAQTALAYDQGKLVQARLTRMTPPAPFHIDTIADLSIDKPEYGPLEDNLARVARGDAAERETQIPLPGWFATPPATGAPKLIALATTLALAAYAGALSAAQNDTATPAQLQVSMMGVLAIGVLCALLCTYRLALSKRAGAQP
jgi:hypothetical protein